MRDRLPAGGASDGGDPGEQRDPERSLDIRFVADTAIERLPDERGRESEQEPKASPSIAFRFGVGATCTASFAACTTVGFV